MQIVRHFAAPCAQPTALTIGNFDGLHLGHRALLQRLAQRAQERGLTSAVLTFEPHPREFFTPQDAPPRLTSLREKLTLLAHSGVEKVVVCRFNQQLAQIAAAEFVARVLVQGLSVKYLLVGDDFRFGCKRAGDYALLTALGVKYGYTCETLHTISFDEERVSSTAVRTALAAGELEHAAHLLGRPYVIAGRVVAGARLGRKLGFPTANIQLRRRQAPLSGVFTVTVSGLAETPLPGVANLGVRPTLGGALRPILEVHLFDFEREIYGAHVAVNFLHKLRAEQKFPDLEALRAQIAQDAAAARIYFQSLPS